MKKLLYKQEEVRCKAKKKQTNTKNKKNNLNNLN
jgi:hypothetical protein